MMRTYIDQNAVHSGKGDIEMGSNTIRVNEPKESRDVVNKLYLETKLGRISEEINEKIKERISEEIKERISEEINERMGNGLVRDDIVREEVTKLKEELIEEVREDVSKTKKGSNLSEIEEISNKLKSKLKTELMAELKTKLMADLEKKLTTKMKALLRGLVGKVEAIAKTQEATIDSNGVVKRKVETMARHLKEVGGRLDEECAVSRFSFSYDEVGGDWTAPNSIGVSSILRTETIYTNTVLKIVGFIFDKSVENISKLSLELGLESLTKPGVMSRCPMTKISFVDDEIIELYEGTRDACYLVPKNNEVRLGDFTKDHRAWGVIVRCKNYKVSDVTILFSIGTEKLKSRQ